MITCRVRSGPEFHPAPIRVWQSCQRVEDAREPVYMALSRLRGLLVSSIVTMPNSEAFSVSDALVRPAFRSSSFSVLPSASSPRPRLAERQDAVPLILYLGGADGRRSHEPMRRASFTRQHER